MAKISLSKVILNDYYMASLMHITTKVQKILYTGSIPRRIFMHKLLLKQGTSNRNVLKNYNIEIRI